MVEITIVLPTKDRPDRLVRAVEAILAQEGPTFELLINNGGGPIPTFDDERVTVLERTTPLTGVLNDTASRGTGRLMHVAADDDVMLPGTLADAIAMDAEWCYGRMRFMSNGVVGDIVGAIDWSAEAMQRNNIVLGPSAFWTRDLWERCDRFDETLQFIWDYEIWARFGARSTPAIRTHVSYHYEVWDGSVSSTCKAGIQAEVDLLHERWRSIGFGNRVA